MKSMKAMKQRTKQVGALCLLAAVFVMTVILIPVMNNRGGGGDPSAVLSTGLSVLAEENSMAMAGIKGTAISFESADFARAVNLSRVDSIVITSVPPITDGELRVGSTLLNEGQTVSGGNLSLLTYTPKGDVTTSSFRFRVGDAPYEMTCMLYLLDSYNASPTVSVTTGSSLRASTYQGTLLYGTLPCEDPEGDATRIEIVSYPASGSLLLTDAAAGRYTYLPTGDATGRDSFTYVARDQYGNYSPSVTVELEILKPATSVFYADLKNSPYANAALTMTDAGIMSGTQLGNATYFQPDLSVSRAEFTKMAMCSLGMTEVAYAETVFVDNAEIPSDLRGFVATAYELGYLRGIAKEEGGVAFEPNRAITRAEAAVMLSGMLDLATPTVTPEFSDSAEIPAWAAPAIYSLHSAGVFVSEEGQVEPLSAVTRGDAASLLTRLMQAVR